MMNSDFAGFWKNSEIFGYQNLVLHNFTELYRTVQNFTELYRTLNLQNFTELYRTSQSLVHFEKQLLPKMLLSILDAKTCEDFAKI